MIRVILGLLFVLANVTFLSFLTVANGDEVDGFHLLIFFTMALGGLGAVALFWPMFKTLFFDTTPRRGRS